jgi:hypothetical protein
VYYNRAEIEKLNEHRAKNVTMITEKIKQPTISIKKQKKPSLYTLKIFTTSQRNFYFFLSIDNSALMMTITPNTIQKLPRFNTALSAIDK